MLSTDYFYNTVSNAFGMEKTLNESFTPFFNVMEILFKFCYA